MKNINNVASYVTKDEAVKIYAADAKDKQSREMKEKEALEILSELECIGNKNHVI